MSKLAKQLRKIVRRDELELKNMRTGETVRLRNRGVHHQKQSGRNRLV